MVISPGALWVIAAYYRIPECVKGYIGTITGSFSDRFSAAFTFRRPQSPSLARYRASEISAVGLWRWSFLSRAMSQPGTTAGQRGGDFVLGKYWFWIAGKDNYSLPELGGIRGFGEDCKMDGWNLRAHSECLRGKAVARPCSQSSALVCQE